MMKGKNVDNCENNKRYQRIRKQENFAYGRRFPKAVEKSRVGLVYPGSVMTDREFECCPDISYLEYNDGLPSRRYNGITL